MNLADFYNMSQNESSVTAETTNVYPLNADLVLPEVTNITFDDNKLIFDMNCRQDNLMEYDFIKFICLSDSDLQNLQTSGFPSSLSVETQEFIFDIKRGDITKEPEQFIRKISVPLKESAGRDYRILIVLGFNAIEDGVVFLLSVNPRDLVRVETSDDLINEFLQPTITSSPSILSVVQDKTYVSDLLYSCSKDGLFSAFYSLDAERVISEYSKFPGFLDPNNAIQFDNFLYKTEFGLYKYDNFNYGYNFEESDLKTIPQRIENIFVQNSDGKLFYQLSIRDVSKITSFQAILKFFFNDISINEAKENLLELKRNKENNNRTSAKQIMTNFYFSGVPPEYLSDYSNLSKLSNAEYRAFLDKVIDDLAEKLQNSQEKSIKNQNVSSQYTSPHFSVANFYEVFLEQTFQNTVKLNNNKDNVFYTLENTIPFKSTSISGLEKSSESYISTNFKSFLKVQKILPVSKFNILSVKDAISNQTGLENRVNCSDENLKKDAKLETTIVPEFLSLSTIKSETTSFSYLRTVGDSVSALLFQKINGEDFDFIPAGQVVLARLDNYDEYYDSYFFIVNDGET